MSHKIQPQNSTIEKLNMPKSYEVEVIIGIEDIVIDELKTLDGIQKHSIKHIRDGFIRFDFDKNPMQLTTLKSVIAVYAIHRFDVPRPKALLGHQNFTRLIEILSKTINRWDIQDYTFGLGAAGSDSSVMQRIKGEISQSLNLPLADDEKGNLYIRLIPAYKTQDWEVLVRLTSRPLATRQWRIKNIPGALNGTVAYAMTQLANVPEQATIVNLCSGTATILIEQALQNKDCHLIALDNDLNMLNFAQENISTSHTSHQITQLYGEAQQTPIQTSSIQCIFADLPFGHHMGSHDENEWLYPAILEESARICEQGGRFVVITHEIQLMQQSLTSSHWRIKQQKQINLNGIHPQIFVLERI